MKNCQKNIVKFGKKPTTLNKKEFDSNLCKTKINSYNGKINTNFHNNKIPEKALNVFLIFDQYY